MIIKTDEAHVLTHLGMGDQITCNGLVRELYKKHSKLYVYCKLKYFYSIEFMYRDLPDLHVLPMEEQGAYNFVSHHKIDKFYKLSFNPTTEMQQGIPVELTVEKTFYKQAGIDFSKKWESFSVQRDARRETQLFENFRLIPGEYIFIHEDNPRKQTINPELIEDKKVSVFRALPDHTNNIFDFCSIIQNAKEIHVIESCMMFLIDLIFQDCSITKKLFIHRYTKPIKPFEYPKNILNWKIYA
jgi:hypothetical protein